MPIEFHLPIMDIGMEYLGLVTWEVSAMVMTTTRRRRTLGRAGDRWWWLPPALPLLGPPDESLLGMLRLIHSWSRFVRKGGINVLPILHIHASPPPTSLVIPRPNKWRSPMVRDRQSEVTTATMMMMMIVPWSLVLLPATMCHSSNNKLHRERGADNGNWISFYLFAKHVLRPFGVNHEKPFNHERKCR